VAREVIEKLVDDLDGSPANETITFGLDGTSYEIDLSKKNAAAFRSAFARYTAVGRRSSSARPAARPKTAPSVNGTKKPKRDFDLMQLREWAGANKVAVPSRGRIPRSVIEQYKAAGGT
jgi:hypothetical protein